MVHPTDNGLFVISSGGLFLPGFYDSKATAELAEKIMIDGHYSKVNDLQNGNPIITMELLKAAFPI